MGKKTINSQVKKQIRDYCHAVEKGEIPSTELLNWVKDRFSELLEGTAPDAVFQYQGKRGRPKNDDLAFRNWELACQVVELQDQPNYTLEKAIEEISEKSCTGESTVRNAWKKYHETIQYLSGNRHPSPAKVVDENGEIIGELDIGFITG